MEEETGQLGIGFGSSDKTSDFMVEALEARGNAWDAQEPTTTELLQSKMDNGPESSGGRTQFRHRLVQFADPIGKPLHLRYYPPDHSKYTPLERCWGSWHCTGMGPHCGPARPCWSGLRV